MDLKYCCGSKLSSVIGIFVLVFCTSCSSPQHARIAQVPVEDLPQILRASGTQTDTTKDKPKEKVTLRYENKSTSVTIPIDIQRQDFILELEGLERSDHKEKQDDEYFDKSEAHEKGERKNPAGKVKKDSSADASIKRDSVTQATLEEKIKQVVKNFRRAQDLFYRQDYEGAMEMVNRSLEVQPTADALGLKGTIFFMEDDMSSARYFWNRAVEMDPDIPVPDIPELDSIIKDIKATED